MCGGDEVRRSSHELIRRRRRNGRAEIVDGIVRKDNPCYARLREHIAFEAVQCTLSRAIDEEPVSVDALIEDADGKARVREPNGEVVRPAMIRVLSRRIAVGDGGA